MNSVYKIQGKKVGIKDLIETADRYIPARGHSPDI
jgi:hypothetical protein